MASTSELEAELKRLREDNAQLKQALASTSELEAEFKQLRRENAQLKQALAKIERQQKQPQNVAKIGLTRPEEQPAPERPRGERLSAEEHPRGRGDTDISISLDLRDDKPPLTRFVDYTSQFATDRVFQSDEEVVDHLKSVGRRYDTQLIKIRSKKDAVTGRLVARWLACERAKTCKSQPEDEEKVHSTKKCGCPFLIKIYSDEGVGWKVEMLNGLHNHDGGETVHAHYSAGKLTDEQLETVKAMSEAKCKPKQILAQLNREKDHTSKVASARHVYNARYKIKKTASGDRSVVQQSPSED